MRKSTWIGLIIIISIIVTGLLLETVTSNNARACCTGDAAEGVLYVKDVKARRIAVPVGEEVVVYTIVQAVSGDVSGVLRTDVRVDLIAYPDPAEPDASFTKTISLKSGETKEIEMGKFIASRETCWGTLCPPGSFREYFVKVWFNDKNIHDPQDPDTRECVKTYKK